jgi:hypothetical protein
MVSVMASSSTIGARSVPGVTGILGAAAGPDQF